MVFPSQPHNIPQYPPTKRAGLYKLAVCWNNPTQFKTNPGSTLFALVKFAICLAEIFNLYKFYLQFVLLEGDMNMGQNSAALVFIPK